MNRPLLEPLEPRALLAATLSRGDVRAILARAASSTLDAPALAESVVVVVDREANVLGTFAREGWRDDAEGREIRLLATVRARTAALFQSRDNAFTTRSARFIIQDHFPTPIDGTPGGPLYGVQFSNLAGSDIVTNAPGISGDPGGIPLFKRGEPVGGIGVAGDFSDVLARSDLDGIIASYDANPGGRTFDGREESDVDESVALAGARDFMADERIRADRVYIDGLALPFTRDEPRAPGRIDALSKIVRVGRGRLLDAPRATPPVPFPAATFAGVRGQLKRRAPGDARFGIVSSDDSADAARRLTTRDVERVIERAVARATRTRAGIRLPVGRPVSVHVSVVDRDGDLLGVFRMGDGTNFSYDVSVQKARTAAFFSDDDHAFSTRAVGFLAQRFFPIGIEGDSPGPLFGIQQALSPKLALRAPNGGAANPLANGITIFPGGVPLYKDGRLVGAVGVSGDGVDQDDLVAFSGAGDQFQAQASIRSDKLSKASIRAHIARRAGRLFELFGNGPTRDPRLGDVSRADVAERLGRLDFRLPYIKAPRANQL